MAFEPGFGVEKELSRVEKLIGESIISEEAALTEVARYVVDAGGKRIRPTVAVLSFHAVGGRDVDAVIRMSAALEMIHAATLVHDDINDNGLTRRGRPAAYRKFGFHNALVAGDFLFVKSFAIGGQFPAEIIGLTAEVCTALAESEIRQRRLAHDVTTSPSQYLDVATRKTALPISAGARIGSILGGGTVEEVEALTKYGLNLGIAFQIVDDILDVIGDEETLGKRIGNDVREGNVTLPAIHALNDGAFIDVRALARLVKKKRKTEREVARVLGMIQEAGAVEKARDDAARFGIVAKEALGPLRAGAAKEKLLQLVDFVVTRNS